MDRFFQSIREIVRRHAAGSCKKLVMQTAAVTFSERMKPRQALEHAQDKVSVCLQVINTP